MTHLPRLGLPLAVLALSISGWAAPAATKVAPPSVAGTLEAPPNDEASGLAASRRTPGLLWTHDDSGGQPEIYAVETGGRLRGVLRLEGIKAEDWEDLASAEFDGKAWLIVADTGDIPPVAAVCVYPSMVRHARRALGEGSGVRIASVATAFPSGQAPLRTRLAEVRAAVEDGADEIDMVINRGAFLAGELGRVQDEISAAVAACGPAALKAILEVSELETYDNIRAASFLALRVIREGDFIKTSTGKTGLNATLGNNQVMLEAIRDHYLATGVAAGMKPAGGIRTAKQALQFLVAVKETLGDAWLENTRYRFGASALLNDLVRQLEKERTGAYQAPFYFSEAAESY